MDFIPLISITFLYFGVAFIKPYLQPKLPFNLCAICVAVSVTWLLLLCLWLMGEPVSLVSIGILMGMSLVGIMYKLEVFYEKNRIRNFWFVRWVLIVGGFYFVSQLLAQEWSFASFLFIVSFFAIIVASLLFQRVKRSHAIKRLDDCC